MKTTRTKHSRQSALLRVRNASEDRYGRLHIYSLVSSRRQLSGGRSSHKPLSLITDISNEQQVSSL